MMNRIVWFCVGASVWYSCGNVENASEDAVAGVYVREYSKEILNQLSGDKVGMRTVRDTLYIAPAGKDYKVENSKWRMNDYDDEGWQDMKHGESGPLPTYTATFDESTKSLKPGSSGLVPSLFIKEGGKLSVGEKSEVAYSKID